MKENNVPKATFVTRTKEAKGWLKNRRAKRALEALQERSERKGLSYCAETTYQSFKKDASKTATDWVVEVTPGVHF
eukprot:3964885-Lingulodinium_polyedra.AAC.1